MADFRKIFYTQLTEIEEGLFNLMPLNKYAYAKYKGFNSRINNISVNTSEYIADIIHDQCS